LKTNIPNFLDYFPSAKGESPRTQQIEGLNAIRKAFESGKKYVIARLPTGSGKSHIATSIARSSRPIDQERKELLESYEAFRKDKNGNWLHSSTFEEKSSFGAFILTITRSLQDQYTDLFPGQVTAKGQNNYQCDVDKNLTVDFAPCVFTPELKQECHKQDRCPYYRARKNAIASQDSVLNYRVFFNLPPFLRRREYIICDEAKEIEKELVGQYTITINYAQLLSEEISFKKIISDDSEEAFQWLQDIFIQLKNQVVDLKHKLSLMNNKGSVLEGILFKTAQRLGKLNNLYNSVWDVVETWHECEFLVESKDSKSVTFVPFNIKPIAQRIFDKADKVILTSATISDPEEYAKSLGIKPNEYAVVDVASVFEPSKSPIYCSSKYSLSFKTLEANLPKVTDMVVAICDMHKDQKGLIHTHTNQITEYIRKKLGKSDRFLFREVGVSNQDIIEEHKNRKNDATVLVSPSLDTGVSLDDDLGRFQIIVKAPYLPLGSKRVKKIFDKSPRYYSMSMLDTLIQMCGRCTRSAKDHSVTYILDGAAVKAVTSNKSHLPKYFLDRFM
jgi:ATP-dependent DNA helicase DinG